MTRTTGGDIIPAQQITGWVDGCYVADMTTFASHPVDELTVDFGGVVGDRHAGRTRRSSQWEPWHKRGTEIRHDRQITIVSPDELAEVAAAMGIAAIRAEWIVANLAFTGILQLSALPAGTRLVVADGPVLFVEGPNDPCRAAGASIGRNYPGRDGMDLLFPKHAKHKRGLLASVDSAGVIRRGAAVTVRVPAQRHYGAVPAMAG